MTEHKSGYILEHQIGFILRQASQRHHAIFNSNMPNGITPTQFSVLNMLSRLQQCSQNLLGRMVGMDAATIKGVIDRLCARGLTITASDLDDARLILVSLTPEGRALAAKCLVIAAEISKEALAPLNATEQKQLLVLLKKII